MSTKIANTAASILNQTVLTAAQAQSVTGLKTFSRAPSAPFAVQAASAKVDNLDADLLDGQEGSYYNNAANLTGTIASATQDLITRTGTIVSGVWSGTFGAVSGAPLTTLNASNISSGSLADARLSANVPRLNIANTFSVAVPGDFAMRVTNSSATGGYGLFVDGSAGTATNNALSIVVNGAKNFSVINNGNVTIGGGNVTDGVGTPTIASGFGSGPSIAGKSYAFVITLGAGGAIQTGTVNLGTTYASAPVVVVSTSGSTMPQLFASASTTQVTITSNTPMSAGNDIHVLVRGF